MPPKSEEIIAESPSTSVTRLFAPRVMEGAEGRCEDRAVFVDHEHIRLPLVGAELVYLLFKRRDVRREKLIRKSQAQHARVVPIEPALEVAGNWRKPCVLAGPHPDGIQLERGHAVMMHELPEFRQLLDQRRDDFLWRTDIRKRVGDNKGL